MAIYINGITVEMFRNAPLEAVEDLMAEGEMIDVPEPHGRLIDADKLKKEVLMWMPNDPCGMAEKEHPIETDIVVSLMMEIEDAPTIIERSKNE